VGKHLQTKIHDLTDNHKGKISNPRGLGLFCAFDCASTEVRNQIVENAFNNNLIILGCGEKAIRFRTPICINENEINEGINILDNAIGSTKL
jgi:L-lysine 6-transaminase